MHNIFPPPFHLHGKLNCKQKRGVGDESKKIRMAIIEKYTLVKKNEGKHWNSFLSIYLMKIAFNQY